MGLLDAVYMKFRAFILFIERTDEEFLAGERAGRPLRESPRLHSSFFSAFGQFALLQCLWAVISLVVRLSGQPESRNPSRWTKVMVDKRHQMSALGHGLPPRRGFDMAA